MKGIVRKFGNSGHIIIPKEYIGKSLSFIVEPRTLNYIKEEVFDIIKPFSENIMGVYLYGSYARKDADINSDVDILIIAKNKLKIFNKPEDYSIISTTEKELEEIFRYNAVLILPIIKEAKVIFNPDLLDSYKKYKFTKQNMKYFIESTAKILELNKKGLELDFDIGSVIYSLILRIRSLLLIKFILSNKLYSKSSLFLYLRDNGIEENKINRMYDIYSREKKGINIREDSLLKKEDLIKLLNIAIKLLGDIR